jgi:hypothetical protein
LLKCGSAGVENELIVGLPQRELPTQAQRFGHVVDSDDRSHDSFAKGQSMRKR